MKYNKNTKPIKEGTVKKGGKNKAQKPTIKPDVKLHGQGKLKLKS